MPPFLVLCYVHAYIKQEVQCCVFQFSNLLRFSIFVSFETTRLYSATGISTLRGYDDEDEDTGSMFQLPDFGGGRKPSKHPAARRRIFNPRDAPLDPISQDPIGSLEPVAVPFPDMSPYLPSRLPR